MDTDLSRQQSAQQQLWIIRFDGFRQRLQQKSLEQPFSGHELNLFINTIKALARRIHIRITARNLQTLGHGVGLLLKYGASRYSVDQGFNIDEGWLNKSRSTLHNEGPSEERSRARTWISYTTLSKMTRLSLEDWKTNGTESWDKCMVKIMSVVVACALRVKAQDPVLRFSDVKIYMDPKTPHFTESSTRGLCAKVVLRKDQGPSNTICFGPLTPDFHMCPILTIMVHALRHGLVHGTSVEQVLAHTAAQHDKTVVWKRPELPLLPCLSRSPLPGSVELEIPATSSDIDDIVSELGVIAGIVPDKSAGSAKILVDKLFGQDSTESDQVFERALNGTQAYVHGAATADVAELLDPIFGRVSRGVV